VIGNGVLLDPVKLVEEIESVEAKGFEVSPRNLKISSAAHLILPHHIIEDALREVGVNSQGSTKSGISQSAADKVARKGIRVETIIDNPDKILETIYLGLMLQRDAREAADMAPLDEVALADEFMQSALMLGSFVTDTVRFLNQEIRKDPPVHVLAEGAQGFQLDPDHGMYPFTTSTSTVAAGACEGLGIPPTFVRKVISVIKADQSHVGGGPFVTEITDQDLLKQLHGDLTAIDAERGVTTGRTRRLGYLDLAVIRRSNWVNDPRELAIVKLDWVPRYGSEVLVCVAHELNGEISPVAADSASKLEQSSPVYEALLTWEEDVSTARSFDDLPENAKQYVEFLEDQLELPITMIGVGPNPDQIVMHNSPKTN